MIKNSLNILLTRPIEKSQLLAEELSPFANHIEVFPLLAYQPGSDLPQLKQQLNQSTYHMIVFVSQAAVDFAFQHISHNDLNNIKHIFAVGDATAKALIDVGITNPITPILHTSEGILALEILQNISSQNILIVRGNGGREYLKEQLQLRGANVIYTEVYKRVWRTNLAKSEVHKWKKENINCIVATSNALLQKTLELASSEHWLKQCVWIVASKRIADNAKTKGLNKVINAQGASNIKIIKAINKIMHPVDINYD